MSCKDEGIAFRRKTDYAGSASAGNLPALVPAKPSDEPRVTPRFRPRVFCSTRSIPALRFRVLSACRFSRTLKGHACTRHKPRSSGEARPLGNGNGRGPDELVEDAMAGYFDELTRAREMLHSGYDDLKSGRAKAISRDELVAHFRDKSTTARHTQSGE